MSEIIKLMDIPHCQIVKWVKFVIVTILYVYVDRVVQHNFV